MEMILDRARPGQENMVIDRALLMRGTPVVRLYGWRPGCISLGYTQPPTDVSQEAVAKHGFDIVERPTGGGAIFHAPSEITYAVVLPNAYPGFPAELYASYAHLSAGIAGALRELGFEPEYRKSSGGREPFCYLREAGVSICVRGKKISGGAQRRSKDAVLQHGTLLVENDPDLIAELFQEDADRVRRGVTSLMDLGLTPDRDSLVQVVARWYRETLGFEDAPVRGPEACDALLQTSTA